MDEKTLLVNTAGPAVDVRFQGGTYHVKLGWREQYKKENTTATADWICMFRSVWKSERFQNDLTEVDYLIPEIDGLWVVSLPGSYGQVSSDTCCTITDICRTVKREIVKRKQRLDYLLRNPTAC